MSILDFHDEDALGRVQSVDTATVVVRVRVAKPKNEPRSGTIGFWDRWRTRPQRRICRRQSRAGGANRSPGEP
jgi:hypothetical protein